MSLRGDPFRHPPTGGGGRGDEAISKILSFPRIRQLAEGIQVKPAGSSDYLDDGKIRYLYHLILDSRVKPEDDKERDCFAPSGRSVRLTSVSSVEPSSPKSQ